MENRQVKTRVEIRISRDSHHQFNLIVNDNESCQRIFEARFGVEEFANLLSSRECMTDGTVWIDQRIGMKRVNDTLLVPYSSGETIDELNARAEVLVKERTDGVWVVQRDKTFNGHRIQTGTANGGRFYRFTILKWVPAEQPEQ